MNIIWIKEPYKKEYSASREDAVRIVNSSNDPASIKGWEIGKEDWLPLEEILFGKKPKENIPTNFLGSKHVPKEEGETIQALKSYPDKKRSPKFKTMVWIGVGGSIILLMALSTYILISHLNDTRGIKYHYPVVNVERKTYLNGIKLSDKQSDELFNYESKVRDYVYSLWELPTRPVRHWKKAVIRLEVSEDGSISTDGLPHFKELQGRSYLKKLEMSYGSDMAISATHLCEFLEGRVTYPPPSFVTDVMPSWEKLEYKYPIEINLDSEVIYSMDELPKTQKRDKSLWRNYPE